MSDRDLLRQAVLARLSRVLDPETGADVVRMRLIELAQLASHEFPI